MSKTRKLIIISIFASLISIGAFIKVPVSLVPVTLQTFFIFLCGLTLNKYDSMKAVILYITIGLIGFPIFASGGGLSYILVPSFGYLIGFIPMCYVISYIKRDDRLSKKIMISSLALGILYLIGIIYFIVIQYTQVGKIYEFSWLFYYLFIVYLPGDIISIVIALYLNKRIDLNRLYF